MRDTRVWLCLDVEVEMSSVVEGDVEGLGDGQVSGRFLEERKRAQTGEMGMDRNVMYFVLDGREIMNRHLRGDSSNRKRKMLEQAANRRTRERQGLGWQVKQAMAVL